jgi:hypothetical protein
LLSKLVQNSRADEDTVLVLEPRDDETLEQLLQRLGLTRSDLGDSFINGRLTHEDDRVGRGDRVGLFPFNMRLIDGGMELKYSPYRREH